MDGVRHQVDTVEVGAETPRAARVLFGDDEVEVARGDLEQAALGCALGDFDAEVGVFGGQDAQRTGHDRVRRGLEDGDPHRPGHRVEGCVELGFGLLEQVEEVGRAGGEELGLGCELHATAHLAQELHTGFALECGELLRDGGGAERERLGDPGDGAADGELAEEPELAYVEHRRLVSPRSDSSVNVNDIVRKHSLFLMKDYAHTVIHSGSY